MSVLHMHIAQTYATTCLFCNLHIVLWKHFDFPAKDEEIIEKKKDRKNVTFKLCFKTIKFSGIPLTFDST